MKRFSSIPKLGFVFVSLFVGLAAHAQDSSNVAAWANKISLGGDMRFRYLNTMDAGVKNESGQIRARLSTTAKVNDDFNANFRLASGQASNTITSSNQTLTGAENKKAFSLDVANLEYHPGTQVTITAGKSLNPFYTAAKNEMLWDADVTFDGAHVKWVPGNMMESNWKPWLAVGYSILNDAQDQTADLNLVGAQIGTWYKGDVINGALSVGSYTYNGVKGFTAAGFGLGAKGNSTTGGGFTYDYKLLDVEGEIGMTAWNWPVSLYGAYVSNSDPSDKNKAMTAGLRVGQNKDVGSFMFDASYRDVGADSMLGTFNDSDTVGGGTDIRGSRYQVSNLAAPGLTIAAFAFFGNRAASAANTVYERYQLDFIGSF